MRSAFRILLGCALASGLTACFTVPDLRPADVWAPKASSLGDFRLGYSVVDAKEVTFGPFSQEAEPAAIKADFEAALTSELSQYAGAKTYHIGVKVDAISLTERDAPVASPMSSVAVLSVSVWDDSTGEKLTPNPVLLVAKDSYDATALFGRGAQAQAAVKQRRLAAAAAARIARWLHENGQWFGVEATSVSGEDIAASEAALGLLVPEEVTRGPQ